MVELEEPDGSITQPGDMFFQENRGRSGVVGGLKKKKGREICAELAEHPMKGGYEFPLGCG